jgi:hypothetical protein
VRAEPRFTRDVDVVVAVGSEAEELVRGLLDTGWRLLLQVEQGGTGRLATVRLAPPAAAVPEGIVVDLLFASSGVEPELVAAAEPVTVFEGTAFPVATSPYLLALKVLAQDERRPQDRADAAALLSDLGSSGLQQARTILRSIEERGYHRGKDLLAELDELLRRA